MKKLNLNIDIDVDKEIIKHQKKIEKVVNEMLFSNPHPFSANGTIFFPPRHKALSNAIKITSPSEARKSIERVKRLKGFTRKQKIASLILASNRALALSKKRQLSERERKELKKVAEIFRKGISKI